MHSLFLDRRWQLSEDQNNFCRDEAACLQLYPERSSDGLQRLKCLEQEKGP